MKKLMLNKVNFAGAEVLTRGQLKKVMGGDGSGGEGSGAGGCGTYPNCSTAACTASSGPCKGQSGTCGKTTATEKCTCAVVC